MNIDTEQMMSVLVVESRELLEAMEAALLDVERPESRKEATNAIFRAAHTIKGSAGLFGLAHVVAFTHVVEGVLERVRDGRVGIDQELTSLLLRCKDHMGLLIDAVADGRTDEDPATARAGAPLVEALGRHLGEPAQAPAAAAAAPAAGAPAPTRTVRLSLRFGREVLRNGMDPLSFLRYLGRLGTVEAIETNADALPPDADMDPEACYLAFSLRLATAADDEAIEQVFEFVRDDLQIAITPEPATEAGPAPPPSAAASPPPAPAATPPATQAASPDAAIAASTAGGATASAAPPRDGRAPASESRSMRVDADKLDHLINLVGELIIAAASADLRARGSRIAELQESTSRLSSLVEEVRDSALGLRMVKVGGTFSRFHRVVRDVARELGKEIALEVSGEDAELDKTLVEKLADPLMHLVRNAIDHGIESPAVRAARGKPARGTIRLNAFHDSGSIVIEVTDDGGGLKKDRIRARALERGLLAPDQAPSDEELFALIFEPGFSTAEKVTSISGRGVGMDVVRGNITALRGSVTIRSEEGVGTTMSVRLPLTLAIINGFLVGIADQVFVIPLDTIEECVDFTNDAEHDYVNLRGQVLPFIRLREHFAIEGAAPRRENVVVVRHAGQRVGLVVDALLGEFQTVIKPLGRMFRRLGGISGSTILGSGDVALILDVAALVRQAGGGPTQAGRRGAIAALSV